MKITFDIFPTDLVALLQFRTSQKLQKSYQANTPKQTRNDKAIHDRKRREKAQHHAKLPSRPQTIMKSNNFPEIKTERLRLRRLKQSDWKMISYLRSDRTVNQFVKRPNADSKEKAINFIKKTNNDIDSQNLYYWCISENKKPEMIGSICLWNFSEHKKVAEVGYDLNPNFQGKGIMNEALTNILDFGFNCLNLEKIEAYTQWANERSRKLLEKNGFSVVESKTDEQNKDNLIYEIKASTQQRTY